MNKETVRARVEHIGILPSIRVTSAADALFAAETVAEAGIPLVEVTMTVPGAIDVIETLRKAHHGLIVGAGTVFDIQTARRCVDAGAHYITNPGLDLEVLEFAKTHDVLSIPGALTPSEVGSAWKHGADFVKIYPVSHMGGPTYIRTLKSPFPQVPMIAAGGVNQSNALDYIRSGASVIGVGYGLIQPDAIRRRERGWIRELAKRYLQVVHEARELLKG